MSGTDLLECGESSFRSLSRLLKSIQQRRNRLVDGSRADGLLSSIESLRGSTPNDRIRVDQSASNDFDDGAFVRFELRFRRVAHDLREGETDTFPLTSIGRGHCFLQNRNDFSQDCFSQLSTSLGETTSGGL